MTRCPDCHKPCVEQDYFCRHCGARLRKIHAKLWRLSDWWMPLHGVASLLAAGLAYAMRVLSHPLFMPFEGSRHEDRVFLFYLFGGLTAGSLAGPLRRDTGRWYLWTLGGILGGILCWSMDYAYMADHVISQAVFQVLNWLDPKDNDSIWIGLGIQEFLRFLGLVLILGMAAGWKSRPGEKLRIILFSLLALGIRSLERPFGLAPGLISLNPGQSALYFTSFFVFFYGLGQKTGAE